MHAINPEIISNVINVWFIFLKKVKLSGHIWSLTNQMTNLCEMYLKKCKSYLPKPLFQSWIG